MPALFMLLMIIIVIALVALFVHDSRQARRTPDGEAAAEPAPPPPPRPQRPRPQLTAVETDELATHVKELRRAVREGLIGRDEAVASILRQSGGSVSDEAAEQLLDRAGED